MVQTLFGGLFDWFRALNEEFPSLFALSLKGAPPLKIRGLVKQTHGAYS